MIDLIMLNDLEIINFIHIFNIYEYDDYFHTIQKYG